MKAPGRRGLLLILSSPSGAGKSTLTRLLLQEERDALFLSISVTTRRRRPSEVEGVHYHFIDQKRFNAMRERAELLEWAEVHGNLYGTPRAPVEEALEAGKDVLFDIDWQGAEQVGRAMPGDVVSVFVLPPSMKELRARLERRAEDDGAQIAKRLANARDEIGHWREYDYVIVNDDLQRSLAATRTILAAERQRRQRQSNLQDFVQRLIEENGSLG